MNGLSRSDRTATKTTRRRYQRIAPVYDLMEILAEARYRDWREQLWDMVEGPKVLEVGVGTGKNFPYYPYDVKVTAIDLTPGMLVRAKIRADKENVSVDLHLGDVQDLDFPEAVFDSVVATFVFCSVPDPILGLRELERVLKPGGKLILLEHVRSAHPLLGAIMDNLNPIVARLMGANINRRTVKNVERSGFQLERIEDLSAGDIFKLIVARKAEPGKHSIHGNKL